MTDFKVIETKSSKMVFSEGYNYLFDRVSGEFHRWGMTPDEDPKMAPAPEILDLEISDGDCIGCKFCYKGNGPKEISHHMTLGEFEIILNKMPKTLTQIAFGLTNLNSNPDFRAMCEMAREQGIVPNFTFNGHQMTDEWADWTAKTCGAVAVSVYDRELTYNAIKKLTDRGMRQVNIHYMLSIETLKGAYELIKDRVRDPRLRNMNAIVFLAYKPKGKNPDAFHTIKDVKVLKRLLDFCNILGISWGCDSCSAPMVLQTYHGTPQYDLVKDLIEPCESSVFSSYINSRGEFFPCSFTEDQKGWEKGLDVLHCEDFIKDIWNHPRVIEFRSGLNCSTGFCLGCPSQGICRSCPVYDITGCNPLPKEIPPRIWAITDNGILEILRDGECDV